MKQFEYIIKDDLGLHARPSGLLVKAAGKYPCEITLAKGEKEVDAKRLFGVMGLNVKCGDSVRMVFNGPEEQEAYNEIQTLFINNL